MSYDIVVRGGTVFDGSGSAGQRADVGIVGDTVATVGTINERGRREVDAEGRYVVPGFIDGHTHLDAQLFWDPLATPSSMHGVTTSIMGNCGFTLAPVAPGAEDLAIRSIERAEDISRGDLAAGVPWGWRTYADYLAAVAAAPKSMNLAGYIGHSALRTFVMGERGYHELAGPDDLAAMARELTAAMHAGAIGFSSSRIAQHMTVDDGPVASYVADWDEVAALAGALGSLGAGVFQFAGNLSDRELQAVVRQLALTIKRPVHLACVYIDRDPDGWRGSLDFLDSVWAAGGQVIGQAHVRAIANVVGFRVGLPFDMLSEWKRVRSRPLAEQRAALENEDVRAALVHQALHGPYATTGVAAEVTARVPDYDRLTVVLSATGSNPTVAELARQRATSPVDVMIDLSLARDFEQYFSQPFANQNEDAVEAIMAHPHTVVAQSDTGAHVSQIMDSSIPTYLLAHWVKERQVLTWEDAIRRLTSEPAAAWGLAGRGRLSEGSAADVVVFDPDTIAPQLPHAESDLPAGGTRLVQGADGVEAVLVNGAITALHGEPTEERSGRLIRGAAAVGDGIPGG
jgi:N-acyl-D-aspartate/D-glutamate deacylase